MKNLEEMPTLPHVRHFSDRTAIMSAHLRKVRLAALRLIEAGLEARPGTESMCF